MKQYDGKKLSKELKTIRFVELGLGVREAAKVIGLSPATICRLEKQKTPDVNTLFIISKWLNKPMDYFFS